MTTFLKSYSFDAFALDFYRERFFLYLSNQNIKIMKNTVFLSVLCLFLISCESDEPGNNQQAKMNVDKDGVSFTITEFSNSLIEETQIDSTGRRLDLRAEVDGGTLFVSISNWDWQNPPEDGVLEKKYDTGDDEGSNTECKETPNATYCDGGLGTYSIGSDIYMTGEEYSDSEGIITISKNDPSNKTVSGSFDFTVEDFFGDSTITFKGTFENLVYL